MRLRLVGLDWTTFYNGAKLVWIELYNIVLCLVQYQIGNVKLDLNTKNYL